MRIVFMGTPDFARTALDALLAASDHEVVAVYTQPPRPGGRRGREVVKSPVHLRAEQAGVPIRHPVSLKSLDEQAAFAALDADVAVVAAYGLILPQPVLDAPRHGCFNIHASLLPRWRGAAPIQRAILAGDATTGVTIMQMEAGLDTGPMLATAATPIGEKTAGELTAELAQTGAALVVQVLADLAAYPPLVQPAGATYAGKIDKAETRLDFAQPAAAVVRQVLAFNPPGAFFEYQHERIRVLAAAPSAGAADPGQVVDGMLTIACIDGAVRPAMVQRAGRGVMTVAEFLRGCPIPAGTQL